MGVAEKVGSQVGESGHSQLHEVSFDCIILSLQRKFLSRKRCETSVEMGQFVADILQRDIVGSLSIKRILPKGPSP